MATYLSDQNMMMATGTRSCLRLVLQARIEREGFVALPSHVSSGVEEVANVDEALDIVERWLQKKEKEKECGNEKDKYSAANI